MASLLAAPNLDPAMARRLTDRLISHTFNFLWFRKNFSFLVKDPNSRRQFRLRLFGRIRSGELIHYYLESVLVLALLYFRRF
jgi:hypothetical protein